MQTTDNVSTRYEGAPTGQTFGGQAPGAQALAPQATFADYKVIRRNGSVVSFEPSKIAIAVTKAFLAVNGGQGAASARVRELVEQLTKAWCARCCAAVRTAAPSILKTSRIRSNSR